MVEELKAELVRLKSVSALVLQCWAMGRNNHWHAHICEIGIIIHVRVVIYYVQNSRMILQNCVVCTSDISEFQILLSLTTCSFLIRYQ